MTAPDPAAEALAKIIIGCAPDYIVDGPTISRAILAAIRAGQVPGVEAWEPIESAPDEGEFLTPRHKKVRRFDMPGQPQGLVIDGSAGRWWCARWFRPLPAPPEGA